MSVYEPVYPVFDAQDTGINKKLNKTEDSTNFP